MVQNKGLIFKEPPTGLPEVGKHLAVEAREFDLEQSPPEGGFTAKVHYVSLDPYQRGRMRAPETASYNTSFTVGEPITNTAIVTIIKSDNPKFKTGDVVVARLAGIEEYTSVGKGIADASYPLQNPFNLDPKHFLGALGMPGLTAYSSLYAIGAPKKGETIFISAASGAVGQIVGQLAKHEGLKVIGSVGDDKKLDFILNDLKFDGGFNYKKETPADALKRLAPDGIDIYYDNVGGDHLEAAIANMKFFGRIIACGMISQYNVPYDQLYKIGNIREFVSRRIKMQGFIVSDDNMGPLYAKEHQVNVQKWIHDGTFKATLHVTNGIDNAGEALLELFTGKNFGKAVLQISDL